MRLKLFLVLPISLFFFFLVPGRTALDLSGTPEIRFALAKLNVLGSVLMIGAHPDDESNNICAYVSRGMKMRFGYLSCTRGEGGQNLIGPEMGEGLGVIRTQELLAARQVDGGSQFFTRAIDFGFTLSVPETLEKWGHERILSDMVWVIRNQQPDVILLSFGGTPADGHGQHQVSAIVGKEAYLAAADPKRFPEQLQYVKPWKTQRLMHSSYREGSEKGSGKVTMDTGEFDPVLGRSYREIGILSRGEHKSQAQASTMAFGTSPYTVTTVAGSPATRTITEGVDTTWNRLPGGEKIGALLKTAEDKFDDRHPENSVQLLQVARGQIVPLANQGQTWAKWKLKEVDEAIALCAGLRLEAGSDRGVVQPGGKVKLTMTALNRSKLPMELTGIHLAGWNETDLKIKSPSLEFNKPNVSVLETTVPENQPLSQPFWLQAKHPADYYDIQNQQLIGRADIVPEVVARFDISINGTAVSLERPLHYRYADPARAEFVRPVAVEPTVAVELPSKNLVVPLGSPRDVSVELRSLFGAAKGSVRLQVPGGWQVSPAARDFEMRDSGEVQDVPFHLIPPQTQQFGRFQAIARLSNGAEVATGVQVIDYSHIPTQTVFHPSEGSLDAVPLKVLSRRVGYVMGASDEIPQALRQMGVQVDLMGEKELTSANLTDYDAIVLGIRAPAVRPDLRANQQRLLEYVKNGGNLVVQYNKNTDRRISAAVDDALNHLGPYPFTFGDNDHRVTQEDAPVKILDPGNSILHVPNEITAADFDGWVQERGLYFGVKWDSHYKTVIECHDKGKPELAGGILYTKYGKGVYIFTAYSWFRQLPAGVPGAYRIFANMISAGKANH